MKKLAFQEKYNAIGRKDSFHEGVFVTAVKTTGIFCRLLVEQENQNLRMWLFMILLKKHY